MPSIYNGYFTEIPAKDNGIYETKKEVRKYQQKKSTERHYSRSAKNTGEIFPGEPLNPKVPIEKKNKNPIEKEDSPNKKEELTLSTDIKK
jgi:hypothetical protein